MLRIYRLTNEPGGLGLSCSPAGLSLAGVPLLHRTEAGLVPRPPFEIASLFKAAYGDRPTALPSRLGAIARALNSGDIALAAIAAVQTRTPDLSSEAALQLAKAGGRLTKYNFNPDEPRDWHGRWTRDGSASPLSIAAPGIDRDQGIDPYISDQRQHIAENVSTGDVTTLSHADDSEAASEPTTLEQTFERKYDDLGPVDFAKQAIQFGDWLGRAGGNLSPAQMAYALAEYSFLQDRLSFWLAYDYKPVSSQGNLLSAALTLYQGAVNGGVVGPDHLPRSMLDVAGTAPLFNSGPPGRPYKPSAEYLLTAPGDIYLPHLEKRRKDQALKMRPLHPRKRRRTSRGLAAS